MKKNAKVNFGMCFIVFLAVALFVPFVSAAAPTFHTSGTSSLGNEDTVLTYNFTANVTYDVGETLTFSFSDGEIVSDNHVTTNAVDFSWISINSSTGILNINVTRNNETGNFTIPINVIDSSNQGQAANFYFNISAVNDVPTFLNLGGDRTLGRSLFELILSASDEEADEPFGFNVTFPSCTHTAIVPPATCSLFNLVDFNDTATNISFTPTSDQRGEYEINFSVNDSYGAEYSFIVNWTLSWDDPPYFTYVCDNDASVSENDEIFCYINASDPDELNNLTFASNYSWFTFNSTGTNSATIDTVSGNASAIINFTTNDSVVGNWFINISVTNSEDVPTSNYTILSFNISNVNDSVYLDSIADITVYTSNTYSVYVNASDNDLLVPDKNVFNETLYFYSNNSDVSISTNTIWTGTNTTMAVIYIDPTLLNVGANSINISVNDSNNFSTASRVFVITVIDNIAPTWISGVKNNYTLTEDVEFYLNLTQNVSDSDSGSLNFTFTNTTAFSSFNLNRTTGIINFTSNDSDVGEHILEINVTDGITPVSMEFNFTVENVNDVPAIMTPIVANNADVDILTSNVTANEDSAVDIIVTVVDQDLTIPSNQQRFYDESFTVSLDIEGPNTALFEFNSGVATSKANETRYTASFTPSKSDVGTYNVTLTFTDASSAPTTLQFNVTINQTLHAPVLAEVAFVNSSVEETLYIDFNVSDSEDGNDVSLNTNFTFSIENLTADGNFVTINETTGIVNVSLAGYAGVWEYNVSVNDSFGAEDFQLINITVYDYPVFIFPALTFEFAMVENVSYEMNFSINHTIQDELNYSLYVNGILKNSTTGYGNDTDFLWSFVSNFTEETTCSGPVNLTLNVSNSKLSNSTNWNVSINHTNYPLSFSGLIGDAGQVVTGGSSASVTLSNYFSDFDASDSCVNQTIGFVYSLKDQSGNVLSVRVANWTNTSTPSLTFSSSASGTANYSLYAQEINISNSSDVLRSVYSNNFTVQLSTSTSVAPSSGGGGGSTVTRPVSLKIIVPEPVSSKRRDKIILPLNIVNTGEKELKEIILEASVTKDGRLRDDLVASFDNSFISSLSPDKSRNVTLIIDVDTEIFGVFEITINATVRSPAFKDYAKVYIEVKEDAALRERIVFAEELIVGNPECAEIYELVEKSKELLELGDIIGASDKIEEAVSACKKKISSPLSIRTLQTIGEKLVDPIALSSLGAIVFGLLYYNYRRIKVRHALRGL